MSDVAQSGRTVLFVSHNLPAVTRLCARTLLVDGGQLVADGDSQVVVAQYMRSDLNTIAAREWADSKTAPGNDIVRLRSVSVCKLDGQVSETFEVGEPVQFDLRYEVLTAGYPLIPVIRVTNQDGVVLFTEVDQEQKWHNRSREPGIYDTKIIVPSHIFAEGYMTVLITINTFSPTIAHVAAPDIVGFHVIEDMNNSVTRSVYGGVLVGVTRPQIKWVTQTINTAMDKD